MYPNVYICVLIQSNYNLQSPLNLWTLEPFVTMLFYTLLRVLNNEFTASVIWKQGSENGRKNLINTRTLEYDLPPPTPIVVLCSRTALARSTYVYLKVSCSRGLWASEWSAIRLESGVFYILSHDIQCETDITFTVYLSTDLSYPSIYTRRSIIFTLTPKLFSTRFALVYNDENTNHRDEVYYMVYLYIYVLNSRRKVFEDTIM